MHIKICMDVRRYVYARVLDNMEQQMHKKMQHDMTMGLCRGLKNLRVNPKP